MKKRNTLTLKVGRYGDRLCDRRWGGEGKRMMIGEKLPSRRESTLRLQSYRDNNARTKNKRK